VKEEESEGFKLIRKLSKDERAEMARRWSEGTVGRRAA
jgi:hypothetical protein